MRILFVTPQVPHPTQGGAAIRNWHLMHAARTAGHTVHLITPDLFLGCLDASLQPLMLSVYRRTFARRLRDLALSRQPDLAYRLGAHRLQPEIARHCREARYDLIQVEGLEMWAAMPPTDIPIIYDAHNAEATLQARMAAQARHDHRFIRAAYSAIQARKLRRYEARVMRRAVRTLTVSEADAAHLRALDPAAAITVVSIGVDTTYYAPGMVADTVPTYDVVFTATFDYRANEDAAAWFLTRVWPRIRKARPDARCALVGRNPHPMIRACDGHDGITVTGSVSDDRPYMAAAGVYILPIRFGAGVRVKLLNAMSMGCAIVATFAACDGIDVWDGTHVAVAPPDPAVFAGSVLSLLNDPHRRATLGRAARAFVAEQYDWSVCTPPLLTVYADLEHGDG